jgi:hypothetical protein
MRAVGLCNVVSTVHRGLRFNTSLRRRLKSTPMLYADVGEVLLECSIRLRGIKHQLRNPVQLCLTLNDPRLDGSRRVKPAAQR